MFERDQTFQRRKRRRRWKRNELSKSKRPEAGFFGLLDIKRARFVRAFKAMRFQRSVFLLERPRCDVYISSAHI